MMMAVGCACAAGVAAPAAHAACADQAFDTVFAAHGDDGLYALVAGGDFESGAAGWTLAGDARVIAEPTNHLNRGADANALQMGPGAVATSPAFCVTKDFRTARMFARALSGARVKGLRVEFVHSNGAVVAAGVPATTAWQPTPVLRTGVARAGLRRGQETTAYARITVTSGTWQIDDVYVDPRMR